MNSVPPGLKAAAGLQFAWMHFHYAGIQQSNQITGSLKDPLKNDWINDYTENVDLIQ